MGELVKSYSHIKSKCVQWLWYPYIPFGKITLLEGDPGDGKTSFILYLASILSKDDSERLDGLTKKSFSIIYQSAEDDKEDLIKPKLESYGADCKNIYFINEKEKINLDDEAIEKSIIETNAKLLILDPLQAFLGDNSIVNVTDLRPLFNRIADVAKRTGCAIVFIGHMNKSSKSKDLYRSMGSIDIVAVARSVLLLRQTDSSSNFRVIEQIKNNITKKGNPIGFEFLKNGKINVLKTVDEEESKAKKKIDLVCQYLIERTTDNLVRYTEIESEIKNMHIGLRTLNEAKKRIGIKTIRKNNVWYWTLLDDASLKENE